MESRIQFRVSNETKRLAQISAKKKGVTLSDACRKLTEDLASEQKKAEQHDSWLIEEVNKVYEKINSGEAEFISNDAAKQIMRDRINKLK